MPRILGVEIPSNKKIEFSLRYIYGIGPTRAKEIIKVSGFDSNRRAGDLNEEELNKLAEKFNVKEFLDREVNVDLSGGEKKRCELFQIALTNPKVALLDEIDSGLDIDAIKSVATLINENRDETTSYLIVTHYGRILKYLDVNQVHIVVDGKIVKSGSKDLIEEVDKGGYTQY